MQANADFDLNEIDFDLENPIDLFYLHDDEQQASG